MKTLEECRAEIDAIDAQLMPLIERRLQLAKDVIEYKMANNLSIIQPGREDEVLKRNLDRVTDDEVKPYVQQFIQYNMGLSKRYQTAILRQYKRPNANIVLIGIMGCGKTTIGQLLAEKTGMDFVDLDDYLEHRFAMSIPDMFAISETYFRDHETLCVKEVSQKKGVVISTGGGVIKRWENIEALKENGVIFYLDRPIANIVEDVDTSGRPLLKEGAQQLYKLYGERHPLYTSACDIHIHNDRTLNDCTNAVIETYTHYKGMAI
ncbi:MAG: chorismate mutase [Erysipelotrichaceae bacterium]|nr:chorismate mutase [Erysipelotrichaceae bacterium]